MYAYLHDEVSGVPGAELEDPVDEAREAEARQREVPEPQDEEDLVVDHVQPEDADGLLGLGAAAAPVPGININKVNIVFFEIVFFSRTYGTSMRRFSETSRTSGSGSLSPSRAPPPGCCSTCEKILFNCI